MVRAILSAMKDANIQWSALGVSPQGCRNLRLGPLTLHARRSCDEWQIALERQRAARGAVSGEITAVDENLDAEGLDWHRWVVADASGGLELLPAMPDRPVVVRPDHPITIPAREKAKFYVSVPVWVRVLARPAGNVLLDVPSLVMSNIWYGDFMEGELCYSLTSRARRELAAPGADEFSRAVCPVVVANDAAEELRLERLCIRVQHIGVLEGSGRLWTNRVDVEFRGGDRGEHITYGRSAPDECPEARQLTQPRVPEAVSLLRRTFRGF